jgi:hypothetical protein
LLFNKEYLSMTQQEIDSALHSIIGESLNEIRRRGFSLADPMDVDFDPEPYNGPDLIDWDDLELRRNIAVVDRGHLTHRAA